MIARALLIGLLLGGSWGCTPEPQISNYQVPRLTEAASEQRMLGAVIPRKDQVWFFKLQGPDAAVAQQAEPFKTLVKSVRDKAPAGIAWQVPTGWTELPGQELRYATLQLPAEGEAKPLEVSVTVFPVEGGVTDEYIIQNLDRWRGQLQLPAVGEKWATETEQIPLEGGRAILCNWVGKPNPRARMMAPFMGDSPAPQTRPAAPAGSAEGTPGTAENDFKYTTPEGWATGETNSMRRAAFLVERNEKKILITVIPLPAAANRWYENVIRWRGQVGLEPVPESELKTEKIPAGEWTADYVELLGKNQKDQPEAIFGAMIVSGERAWFVKLQGDAEIAQSEKDRFRAFIKSLQIP